MRRLSDFKNSVFAKYLLTIFCAGVLPMLVLFSAFFELISANLKTNIVDSVTANMLAASEEIDKDAAVLRGILESYEASDSSVFAGIQPTEFLNDARIKEKLKFLLNKNKNIENLILINGDYNWTFASKSDKYANLFYSFEDDETFECLKNNSGDITVLDIHSQPYFNNMTDFVVSFVKNYYSRGTYIGSMVIDVKINYFMELIKPLGKNAEAVRVTSGSGLCLYSTRIREIGAECANEDIPVYDIENVPQIKIGSAVYLTAKPSNTGWCIWVKLSKNRLFENIYRLRVLFFCFFGGVFALLLIISYFAARSFSRPIEEMVSKIKCIGTGDMDVRLPENSADELGVISHAVNSMTDSLKNHIKTEYYYRVKQKEAELNAIKMQIKPHFLYNTLEIIRVCAKEEGAAGTVRMIGALAKQLRYLLKSDDRVTLKDELDSVYDYLDLVKLRFENNIEFTENVNADTLDCEIPKVILQPVIENCFKHAMPENGDTLFITLSACICDEMLEISVFDNGRGISAQKLKALTAELNSADGKTSESIGLKSVNEQIRLRFGNEYGISVESAENAGTLVRLLLPVKKGGEKI